MCNGDIRDGFLDRTGSTERSGQVGGDERASVTAKGELAAVV